MSLRLYNTLTRSVEEFHPMHGLSVGMYTCGMTVYDHTHIGHMRKYTMDDILRRTLEYLGYTVKHVMNVTDVGHLVSDADEGEDKMEKGARRENVSVWEVARKYEEEFFSVLKAVHIQLPDVICRATDHIAEQIELVRILEEKGYIYRGGDGMYFDTGKFPAYPVFPGVNVDDLQEGARVAVNQQKRHHTDFAVWKFSPKNEQRQMEWESPWGVGFPGWHIECSAMSMKYLGETFDIHTGGEDHIPIHHPNEIAQSQCATGKPLANYWFHTMHLTVDGVKMSKSLHNFYTLPDMVQRGIDPLAARYLFLGAQYRSKQNFTWEALQGAQNALERLQNEMRRWGQETRNKKQGTRNKEQEIRNKGFQEKFQEVLEDDVNTPRALAVVWDVVKSGIPEGEKKALLLDFDRVLGLGLADIPEEKNVIPDVVQHLVVQREDARNAKDFQAADALRKEIESQGFRVEDTPQGVRVVSI